MKKTIYFSVFKPLRAASVLLTNFLHNGKCWLYNLLLVLTCCSMLGSGQLVLGQPPPDFPAIWNYDCRTVPASGVTTVCSAAYNGTQLVDISNQLFPIDPNCGSASYQTAQYYPNVTTQCILASPCALAYCDDHSNGDVNCDHYCAPCACATPGATNCPLLPDLVASAWIAANVTVASGTLVFQASNLTLPISTGIANIGSGPFEVQKMENYFCCDEDDNCVETPNNYCNEEEPNFQIKEQLKQLIYHKTGNASNSLMTKDDYLGSDPTNDPMIVFYHPQHQHLHVEDWISVKLCQRPPATDPNFNNPDAWLAWGENEKISFCVVNDQNCICKQPLSAMDMTTAQTLNLLSTYGNDVWKNQNSPFWKNPSTNQLWTTPSTNPTQPNWQNFIKNKITDFPNYLMGRTYAGCLSDGSQGISPGYVDVYQSVVPGNFISLPCDMPTGDYFAVVKVNPKGKFLESNYNNNTTVIPVHIDMPSSVPFSGTVFNAHQSFLVQIDTNPDVEEHYPVWSTDNRINGTVVVPNGVNLTIEHCTIEFMTPESGIIVEKGGRLTLDHATLKGNQCLNNKWAGITVNGNGFVPHPANYLTTNSPNHGIVIADHSTIQDATTAILTADNDPDLAPMGYTAYTGGGIVVATKCTLLNNLVGIHIGKFYGYDPEGTESDPPANAQRSVVTGNTFITANVWGNGSAVPVHLYLQRAGQVAVNNNMFQATANGSLTNTARGTGIVAINTATTIGTDSNAPDADLYKNTFLNLYKGIDIYNTLTSVSVTNVVRNHFLETDKGITLNTSPYTTIRQNIFDVKTGTANNDTYGVLALGSFGNLVQDNFFNSNAPDGNLNTKGIVLQQSFLNTNQQNKSLVLNNQFSQKFSAATQIEGDCRNLQLSCNMYYNTNKYDWYVATNYPFVVSGNPIPTLLDPQGACSSSEPQLSFATYWHPTATGSYHIKNNAIAPITINYDIDSNPILISGNVVKNSCSLATGQTIDNTSCEYVVTPPDGGECCTNGIACTSDIDVAGRIRTLIKQNNQTGVVAFLSCIDEVWAYRLLVTTLIDQGKYSQALTNLLRIPDDSPDNIAFKAMCNAIIANLQAGTNIGGRQSTQALQQLRTIAQARQSTQTPLAQSNLALLQGDSYVRTSVPIQDDKTESNQIALNQLTVVPNPAQNYVQVICGQQVPNAKLLVYDLNGRLLKTTNSTDNITFTVDTSTLPTGIYYCTVANTTYTAKLVIVK